MAASANKIKQARALRDVAIQRLDEIHELSNTAKDNPALFTNFKMRFSQLDTIYMEFNTHHNNLLHHLSIQEDAEIVNETEIRQHADEAYFAIKTVYHDLFEVTNSQIASPKMSNVKLPKINIPSFNGNMKEWPTFIGLYQSLIHDKDALTDIEKFQYLLSTLSGEALTLIRNIKLTGDNYQVAYKKLTDTYQSRRVLATYYWEQIIKAPKLTSKSPQGLKSLLSTFSDNLEALKNLKFPTDNWDFILVYLLSDKVDSETLEKFEVDHNSQDVPAYTDLFKFLKNQCVAFNSVALIKSHNSEKQNRQCHKNKYSSPHSTSFMTNTSTSPVLSQCPLCKSTHTIYKCSIFNSKSPREKYNLVKQNKWCTNCLGHKHTSKSCDSKSYCKVCTGKHHTLLHFDNNISPSNVNESSPVASTSQDPSSTINNQDVINTSPVNSLTNVLPTHSTVLLSTAQIEVLDFWGNYQSVRILLDCASQANVITEQCANRLGLSSRKTSLSIHGLAHMSSTASSAVTCTIRPKGQVEPIFIVDAVVLPKICSNMPSVNIPSHKWNHLANLHLADPKFNISAPVDMLLGADIFPQVLRNERLTGGSMEPIALNTVFGWIVMGKLSYELPFINSFCTSIEVPLDSILKKFWEVEEVPPNVIMSSADQRCEDIFVNTHFRNSMGRYVVSLPFDGPEPLFSDTRSLALRRFYSLERRLIANPPLYSEYSEFLKDYLAQGHMELVDSNVIPEKNYYIPHHCVINPNSSTTKLRVVFDASAKSLNGLSLNDTLLTGKKLQKDIFTLLLNFRLYAFVITADVKQMYRQISVVEGHRDYQRILWRFSSSTPIQDYRLTTVTYGVSSAPFLALRSLLELAEQEKMEFPLASHVLSHDIYVDDIVTGANTLNEAKVLQTQLTRLLSKGGFQLRKWASNTPELLENISKSDCQHTTLSFDSESKNMIKVLGLQWHPAKDSFCYEVSISQRPCTKRSILSDIARIFDPLGFLAPLTLFAKYLIQYLWSLGLNWDQTPPSDVVQKWTQFQNELKFLSSLNIPRRLVIDCDCVLELHGFCDSSEIGYCAVIFLRVIRTNGIIETCFICAKTKVAPLRRLSVPRLELCAAVLLANLMEFVRTTFCNKLIINNLFAWTDSTVILHWIKSSPHKWKTFVGNRVSHIQSKISPNLWHHVRSQDNPADCGSRGLMPSALINHKPWWTGPPWLTLSRELWPPNENLNPIHTPDEERKLTLISLLSLDFIDTLLDKFSSLTKITRIVAYCLRFINNTRTMNKQYHSFTQYDLQKAQIVLIKRVQYVTFKDEIVKLDSKLVVCKQLRKLNPFIGEDGLLRVGGRLMLSGLSFDHQHPPILPRQHRLTELIIEHTHRQYLHPGLQTLQALLAQRYWILSSRRAIRHVLSKCNRCFRVNPTPLEPLMGNLPSCRINKVKPFSCVGVDYGGPFNITLGKRRGIKSQKAYICLFVCCSTKALHLELASDLSTDAFLAALRRFIARRGRCARILSDCGTNFVGANRVLSEYMQHAAAEEAIEWSFNPPSAPHFGGLWESGIKSVKSHLIRVVGHQVLTYEEFYTLLVQIEAILNSRPLYPLSSDPNDLFALTPGHFLTLEPLTALPDPNLKDININHLNRWQLLQRMHQDFWKRWNNEYLHTLQQRRKWTKPEKSIDPGLIVLLKDESLPPLQWRLGRIEKVHLGPDGIPRVATIKTTRGFVQRPLTKLCPLPSQ